MKRLIVGNWKEHFNPGAASAYYHKLNRLVDARGVDIVLCPPMLDIYALSNEIDRSKYQLGAQNLYYENEGPYTGETSAAMLKGLVKYAIIGHSERRIKFSEDNLMIAKKVAAAIRNGIKPILCIGETLYDRSEELTSRVVVDQLTVGLHFITKSELENVVIAYEPVWAVGTGDFAKPDDVIPVAKLIHQTITELYGDDSPRLAVLYGGSTDPDNAGAYLALNDIAGLLVGGSSVNADKFARMIDVAEGLQ